MVTLKANPRLWLVTGAVLLAVLAALGSWIVPVDLRSVREETATAVGKSPSTGNQRNRAASPDEAKVNAPTPKPENAPGVNEGLPPVEERKVPSRDLKSKQLKNEQRAKAERKNRQKAIADRDIIDGAMALSPEFRAIGSGDATSVYINGAGRPRRTGYIGPGGTSKTRRVHGRAYEVKGSQLVPLGGVVVADWGQAHRAITDASGWFEMAAYFSEPNDGPPDDNPANDKVWLAAGVHGYIYALSTRGMSGDEIEHGGGWYTADVLDSEPGVEFFFARAETETLHVRITNPPPDPTVMTLWMGERGKSGYGGALLDEDYYVSVHADAEGKATFYLPFGLNWAVGAFGPGWQRAYHDDSPQPRVENGEVHIDIKVEPCETVEITGECVDLRTGLPLPNIRLTGSFPTNEAAFTNAQGRFTIHVATKSQAGNETYLSFSHPYYVNFAVPVVIGDRTQFVEPESAIVECSRRGSGAWWRASMRPLVRARGLVVRKDGSPVSETFLELFSGSQPFLAVPRNADVDAEGRFEADYFPWGRTTVSVGGVRGTSAIIDESCWHGDEPFNLRVIVP